MLTDPIADMLTRIRNANKAMHDSAEMPTSRMKGEIARVLKAEGYIKDFRVVEGAPFYTLVIELKFGATASACSPTSSASRSPAGASMRARIVCRACSEASARRSCPPPPASSRGARRPSVASAAKSSHSSGDPMSRIGRKPIEIPAGVTVVVSPGGKSRSPARSASSSSASPPASRLQRKTGC